MGSQEAILAAKIGEWNTYKAYPVQFASYQSEIGVVLRLCQQKHPVYVPTSYIPEKVSQEEKNEREREREEISQRSPYPTT